MIGEKLVAGGAGYIGCVSVPRLCLTAIAYASSVACSSVPLVDASSEVL